MVQEVGERLSISLDLEVDGRMPLSAAHDLATTLERAIQADLDPTIEVDTHIEPLRVSPLAGANEDAEVSHQIAEALKTIATSVGHIADVHNVRVRRTEDGLVVNYHCRVDPSLTVASVHAHVDESSGASVWSNPTSCVSSAMPSPWATRRTSIPLRQASWTLKHTAPRERPPCAPKRPGPSVSTSTARATS
jgi:hypothetical protein